MRTDPLNTPVPRALFAAAEGEAPGRLLHAGRNRTKARIWLVGEPPGAVVVKDISGCPVWVRRLFARRSLAREARAYRALEGLAGVPRLVAFDDPERLEISHVEGVPLPRLPRERLDEALFDRIAELVARVHARGVVCGDVHHRNVIVAEDGSVHLVDFALAAVARPGNSALRAWMHRAAARLDETAVLRMRLRYLHRDPTPAERALLDRGSGLWRAGRSVKRLLRRIRGKR